MAFDWGLGPATDRILKRYGSRSGSIINATGTGLTVWITYASSNEGFGGNFWTLENLLNDLSPKGDGEVPITAFSGVGEPLRFSDAEPIGKRIALDKKILTYARETTFDIDISVIGNSLDYYRLSMLYGFYQSLAKDKQCGEIPLIDIDIIPNSAPGMTLLLSDGIMTRGNIGINVGGNARISDKTFSFSFYKSTTPSFGDQKYEQSDSPSLFDNLIGY